MKLLWLAVALFPVAALFGQPAAEKPVLHSSTIDYNSLVAKPTAPGENRRVFNNPTATFANFECHVTTLNPGQMPHPSHHHPEEEFLVIRTGTLTVTVNGKPQVLGPGSIAFFASNEEHSVKNTGSTQANYTVFRIRTLATPK
jgi:quercetin dioxygenase-like cupin family protein